jgi:hypothetical protein
MLQCIAPFLTIDQKAFVDCLGQYQHWTEAVRYACTYHHPERESWASWAWNMVPNIPFVGSQPEELAEPRRDPAHEHPNFVFGYGIGPITDSYTGMYAANGEYRRVPGKCHAEAWDPTKNEPSLVSIYDLGETNEFIHPVCRYRDLIRGFEANAALKNFERKFEVTDNATGKGRFVWNKKNDAKKLDEWIIKLDEKNEINYERRWYRWCEQWAKPQALNALENDAEFKKFKGSDWLDFLDSKNDFRQAI